MLKWFKRAILIVVLAFFLFIGLFFAIRNGNVISLDLVLWQAPELSVALLMIIALGLGVILALLSSGALLLRLEGKLRKQNKQIIKQQAELDNLRKANLSTELAERE